MVSGLRDKPIPADMLAIGEIGLGGEVRSVLRIADRIREAERLGFTRCLVPQSCLKELDLSRFSKMKVVGVRDIVEALRSINDD